MWGEGQPGEREFQVGERWARGGRWLGRGWSAAGFRAIHSFLVTVRSEEKSSPFSSLLFPGERKSSVISFSFSLIMGAASFLSSYSGRTDHR